MTYKEYELVANQTALYCKEVAVSYVTIGLAGEIGELFEKMSYEAGFDDVVKELGDVFWYAAMIRVELDLDVEDDWDWNKDLRMPDAFDLVIEAGKLSEQVKKYLRDDYVAGEVNVFSEKRKKAVTEAWKNLWSYLGGLAKSFGTSIEEVALKNNEKLSSRAERNVIHGEGDNR